MPESQHPTSSVAAVPGPSGRRSLIAEISSLLALTISIVALGVSAYQTRLMQQQARASVWPLIKIGYRVMKYGDTAGTAIQVSNNGVGPAKIESFKVTFDNKPVHRWEEIVTSLGITQPAAILGEATVNGQVQPPSSNRETTIEPLLIGPGDPTDRLVAAMPRIGIEICYCSVYDDCWTAAFHSAKVQKVPACPESGDGDFDG